MQNSIFVSKCRIFRNRLLFLHPKGGPKASGRLPPNTSQQTGTTCTWRSSPQAPLHNKSEHTEAKIRENFFHASQQRAPEVPLLSMCRITRCHGHTSTCRFSRKVAAGISLTQSATSLPRLSLAACFMPQSFWPRCCYLLLLPDQVFVPAFFFGVFYNNPGEQKLSTCRRHQEIGAKRKGKTRRAFGNDLMTTMFWDEGNHSTDDSPVFFLSFPFLWLDQLGLDGFGAGR